MRDLTIELENRPGALAEMGEVLGAAGVSVEGGGGWLFDGKAIAHFLFEDGGAARKALEAAGITVLADREVLVQKLNQGQPGQLGKIARMMAAAGANIEVQYSDHDNQLILVVGDIEKGKAVSEEWKTAAGSIAPPEQSKGFNLVTVAYYFGALLMISACAWFLGDKWDALGSPGVLITAGIYLTIAATLGWWLRKKGYLVGGGLLITVAVCLVPLITYAIEDILGYWPGDHPGDYKNYYEMV